MEYSQTVEIPAMTFEAINGNKEEGLRELVKGLEEIYHTGLREEDMPVGGITYASCIERYIGMFVLSYEEEDMILFGKLLSESFSSDFKLEILKILKRCIWRNEDKEGMDVKGNILEENIKP